MTDGDQKTDKVEGVRYIEVFIFSLFNEHELVCVRKQKDTSPCSMSVRSDHMKPFFFKSNFSFDLSEFDNPFLCI